MCCAKKKSVLKKVNKLINEDDDNYPSEFDPFDYDQLMLDEDPIEIPIDKTRDELLERTQPMLLGQPEINPMVDSSVDTKHQSLRKIKIDDSQEESKEQPTVPVVYHNHRIVRQEQEFIDESACQSS